jgi:hypothetical protein
MWEVHTSCILGQQTYCKPHHHPAAITNFISLGPAENPAVVPFECQSNAKMLAIRLAVHADTSVT